MTMKSDRLEWLKAALTALTVVNFVGSCENALDSKPQHETIIFDSGRGTGQYDQMTYATYESRLRITPSSEMTVASIRPQMWFCNGSCGFTAFIMNEHSQPLGSEAGLVDGTGGMVPTFSDRQLDSTLVLRAGTTYEIRMTVWTTRSVGIYTTGQRSTGIVGNADYFATSAKSENTDHLDRGAIAFQLLK